MRDGPSCEEFEHAEVNPRFLFAWLGTQYGNKLDWSTSNSGLALALAFPDGLAPITEVDLYLKNEGSRDIEGVIRSSARCVLEINGQFYAQQDLGGKSSYMPPGREYGPLAINLFEFFRIPNLEVSSIVPDKPAFCRLPKGPVTIRVYYKCGPVGALVKSNDLKIENP
jgi:hypothetical protein